MSQTSHFGLLDKTVNAAGKQIRKMYENEHLIWYNTKDKVKLGYSTCRLYKYRSNCLNSFTLSHIY